MQLSEALNRTLEEYGISAVWLAERSGVSQRMISQFRNGKQRIYSDSLERIMENLPPDARTYFFQLLGASPASLRSTISLMDDAELAFLLSAIAEKLQKGKSQQLLSA
jgi:transcriptional regulator with XRE-family HTH domain